MPMWGAYWGPPWVGFWWIFPLIGLVIMVVMVFACFRMMGGMSGFGCMSGHGSHASGEREDLRRQLADLKAEIRRKSGGES